MFLASSDRPGSVRFSTCVNSMVLPYGSLASMGCFHLFGGGLFDAILAKIILAPESDISRLVFKRCYIIQVVNISG